MTHGLRDWHISLLAGIFVLSTMLLSGCRQDKPATEVAKPRIDYAAALPVGQLALRKISMQPFCNSALIVKFSFSWILRSFRDTTNEGALSGQMFRGFRALLQNPTREN